MSARLSGVSFAFLLGCSTVLAARQAVRPARSGIDNEAAVDDGLLSVLQIPVPPVVIHEVVFGRPVELIAVQAVDAGGTPVAGRIELAALGAGLAVGKDGRLAQLETDVRLLVGDVILGGVIENRSDTGARLSFGDGTETVLGPGERLYVGSRERLVRGADDAPADGGAAEAPPKPSPGPGTHCPVCSCACQGSACSCTITFDTSGSGGDSCGAANGDGCECGGESSCSGSLSGCNRVWVPCPTL